MGLSTKDQIAHTLEKLMIVHPYRKITVQLICEQAHVTRQTFYNYFIGKEDALRWIVLSDYQKTIVPMVRNKAGDATVSMHFRYVREKGGFYSNLCQIDDGMLLHKLLMDAYDSIYTTLFEISDTGNKERKSIKPDLYLTYYHSGVASIVVYWVHSGYEMPEKEISQALTILLNNKMQDVRVNYLDLE